MKSSWSLNNKFLIFWFVYHCSGIFKCWPCMMTYFIRWNGTMVTYEVASAVQRKYHHSRVLVMLLYSNLGRILSSIWLPFVHFEEQLAQLTDIPRNIYNYFVLLLLLMCNWDFIKIYDNDYVLFRLTKIDESKSGEILFSLNFISIFQFIQFVIENIGIFIFKRIIEHSPYLTLLAF